MLLVSSGVATRIGAHRDFQAKSIQKYPKSGMIGIRQERRKRLFDFVVAGAILLFLSPLMLVIALSIRLTSSGPALFKQKRYGRFKREFEILKFRTMTVMEDGREFKQAQRGDARITKLGAFLRRTSLDELPQLWNVVRGDMSLVGPRPHAISMDDDYAKQLRSYNRRFLMRPGITGLAQCTGFRGGTDRLSQMIGRIGRDIYYVRYRTMSLDIKILFMTAISLLTDDAY